MNVRQLVLAAVIALAACPANNTPQAIPPSPVPATGYEPPAPPPSPVDARTPDPGPDAAPAVADAAVAAQADGAPCLAERDCASGVCEGLGCGADAPGVCVPRSRRCTRDRRAYCGCDGTTFFASGTCPGKRYSARQMCPDGQ